MNLNFPEIPSKTQIFKREQTRMDYFRALMDKILFYTASYGANAPGKGGKTTLKTRLLEVLYKLLMIEAVPVKELTSERLAKSPDEPLDDFSGVEVSMDQPSFTGLEERAATKQSENFEQFIGYMDDEDQKGTRFGNTERNQQRAHLQGKPLLMTRTQARCCSRSSPR